jgi:asparagine synthase (glutamine-hydrolysing)
MCGITGFIDSTRSFDHLTSMTASLAHRGPDDHGYYCSNGVGLGHRRLSIIDLSDAGHQPMEFKQMLITYNGEIYNFKEIKKELENNGYSFNSNSDTEVIIKAFDCWKERCVQKFIGMFAFAIYDVKDDALYLFRDRVGVKPLYYYHNDGAFAFASELKSFKHYLNDAQKRQLDTGAISSFFRYGYISKNRSIIENVFKVPPGHYLIYKNKNIDIHQYWSVDFVEDPTFEFRKEEDILDELEEIVVTAFKYRMVADVPVGVFLSAGIDSSLVASVLSRHYGHINTFTIGFKEKDFDESGDAKNIATYLKTSHHEAILGPTEAQNIIDHFYDIYDEPHGDYSCVPTSFVSTLAKSKGMKVVLSADGGDELFGGYERYTSYVNRWNQLQRRGKLSKRLAYAGLKQATTLTSYESSYKLDRFTNILSQKEFSNFYQSILRANSNKELKELLRTDKYVPDELGATNMYNQMMEWDFFHYLPNNNLVKVDRATMYNNIEGREPFLDQNLIEFASRLPVEYKIKGGVKKYLLKKLLHRYLPKQLYDLPKRGFGAPLELWLKKELEKEIELTFAPSTFENEYLNKQAVFSLINRYKQKKKVNMVTIWYLYSFQKWYNNWLKN